MKPLLCYQYCEVIAGSTILLQFFRERAVKERFFEVVIRLLALRNRTPASFP